MKSSHKGIADYLRYISTTYQLDICIKDYIGFLNTDNRLFTSLQPFFVHSNPYCMEIKSNAKLWERCISFSHKVYKKAQNIQTPFYGMCYCGVGEYVVPVSKNGFVIAVILAGTYSSSHHALSEYRMGKVSKQYQIDYEILEEKFNISIRREKDKMDKIIDLLGIIADYFTLFYSTITPPIPLTIQNKQRKHFSQDYILAHALEYINKNLAHNITVQDIAKNCHCSESYISRIFKNNMNMNINPYINKLRIKKSKFYLTNYDINVAEIATKVGFNDPNYFSLVFKNCCGISPTEYKKTTRP